MVLFFILYGECIITHFCLKQPSIV